MNLIILPGNSPEHERWLNEATNAFEPFFDEIHAVHYRHWQTGAPEVDESYEIEALRSLSMDMSDSVILAKSVGTVIASRAISEDILRPRNTVFLGLPITNPLFSTSLEEYGLQNITPLTIVQNTNDPYGSFAVVQAFMAKIGATQATLVETPGQTHDYEDYEQYSSLLLENGHY